MPSKLPNEVKRLHGTLRRCRTEGYVRNPLENRGRPRKQPEASQAPGLAVIRAEGTYKRDPTPANLRAWKRARRELEAWRAGRAAKQAKEET